MRTMVSHQAIPKHHQINSKSMYKKSLCIYLCLALHPTAGHITTRKQVLPSPAAPKAFPLTSIASSTTDCAPACCATAPVPSARDCGERPRSQTPRCCGPSWKASARCCRRRTARCGDSLSCCRSAEYAPRCCASGPARRLFAILTAFPMRCALNNAVAGHHHAARHDAARHRDAAGGAGRRPNVNRPRLGPTASRTSATSPQALET